MDGVEVTDPVEVRELALGDGDVTEVGERGRLEVEGADIGWLCGRECYRRRATHKAPGRHGPGGRGGRRTAGALREACAPWLATAPLMFPSALVRCLAMLVRPPPRGDCEMTAAAHALQ